jgi:pyruvate formate lyase activating enzyme
MQINKQRIKNGRKEEHARCIGENTITRRGFLRASVDACAAAVCASAAFSLCGFTAGDRQRAESSVFRNRAPKTLWKWSREAYHYRKTGRNVTCLVCPNECTLRPGDRSICRNKVYHDGKLYTLAYGNPCAVHIDPMEKKPLFHFYPSTPVFSIATAGCNFRCLNCQNWSISQSSPEETKNYDLPPEEVVRNAVSSGCRAIAYTYSEPTSFYEYMFDTARLAREQGIRNVWVTNGYINEKPLKDLCKYIDAANIDLKSFNEGIYSKLNAGRLKPVLNTIETCRDEGVWFEITNLVIPGWTDDPDMIARMCEWLCERGFDEYPLHFSRFFPMHKLTHLPPTPIETLREAGRIAMQEGMKYVYLGNVPEAGAQDTLCPRCGEVVVKREGYVVTRYEITQDGTCRFCGEPIAGVWENG